ncbi:MULTISPECIES: hypothetical protein [Loigolactobacillus]|uniref:Uncharacterized protein n=1 Tax=Loigolactobacillus backii TaxID=375175 RepID=A0A192H0C4_9LACO|nr:MULTISPECIES: hypothetical protein [Loigolactobacillus]ANK60320.1 hypothetical protein AYR52_08705 [Loigolactobacillus backii]ANK62239.1 hypothetical protein AYR53_05295 [Loigolactobacillus backii]ANK65200.1 hypothetical protein AYR54_08105 [Loigolactobacillus backii]ANK67759.1 hypothetical protein AYR55_08715 [Loigolactobacillus backii]ANK70746.1 hypothetical protein AYR56_11690 [Loigolactobacillus backii]
MAEEQAKTKKPEITYDQADIDKAVDLIKKQGYVTRKDIPNIDNDDWAKGFTTKISDTFHNADEDPYIYYERYDFADHEITGIIFDMDQTKTRQEAGRLLGQALKLKSFE